MSFNSYTPPALRKIQERVRNFRDLSKFCQGYIKGGMIYRSSSLIEKHDESLQNNLQLLEIKSIIDLRTEIEIVREAYKDWFLHEFSYYWVHLDITMPDNVLKEYNKENLPFYHQFIWYTLYKNQQHIQRIFDIFSRKINFAIVLHCHEGRDRTGIIAALILLLMNVPEDLLIQDYLASDPYTKTKDIEYLLHLVNLDGGIRSYLKKIGVKENIQDRIVNILRP